MSEEKIEDQIIPVKVGQIIEVGGARFRCVNLDLKHNQPPTVQFISVLVEMEAIEDARPHSRACGITLHPHGPRCHSNCPTCHGEAISETRSWDE